MPIEIGHNNNRAYNQNNMNVNCKWWSPLIGTVVAAVTGVTICDQPTVKKRHDPVIARE